MTSIPDFYDRQWKHSNEYIFSLAFTQAIAQSYSFLGELNGKTLLEIGCGSGEQACYFARLGGVITVIDISQESLNCASQLARHQKVKLKTVLMDAQQLAFPAQSFDLIYINSTLMHVDSLKVFEECSRVLKADGKLVLIEPMQFAPLVKFYRFFSSYRKMKPKYLTFRMIREGRKYFSEYRSEGFYLFSSLLLPVFFVRIRWLQGIYRSVAKIDSRLVKWFSFLQYGCWVSVTEFRKPPSP